MILYLVVLNIWGKLSGFTHSKSFFKSLYLLGKFLGINCWGNILWNNAPIDQSLAYGCIIDDMFSRDCVLWIQFLIFFHIHSSHLVREWLSRDEYIWSPIDDRLLPWYTILISDIFRCTLIKSSLSFWLYGCNLWGVESFVIECTREIFIWVCIFFSFLESIFICEIFLKKFLFACLAGKVHLSQGNRWFFRVTILSYDRTRWSRKRIIFYILRISFPSDDRFPEFRKVIGKCISSHQKRYFCFFDYFCEIFPFCVAKSLTEVSCRPELSAFAIKMFERFKKWLCHREKYYKYRLNTHSFSASRLASSIPLSVMHEWRDEK